MSSSFLNVELASVSIILKAPAATDGNVSYYKHQCCRLPLPSRSVAYNRPLIVIEHLPVLGPGQQHGGGEGGRDMLSASPSAPRARMETWSSVGLNRWKLSPGSEVITGFLHLSHFYRKQRAWETPGLSLGLADLLSWTISRNNRIYPKPDTARKAGNERTNPDH